MWQECRMLNMMKPKLCCTTPPKETILSYMKMLQTIVKVLDSSLKTSKNLVVINSLNLDSHKIRDSSAWRTLETGHIYHIHSRHLQSFSSLVFIFRGNAAQHHLQDGQFPVAPRGGTDFATYIYRDAEEIYRECDVTDRRTNLQAPQQTQAHGEH
ncbi:uncharacterized protein isoform X4 [Danio rerio]|uniref:Uncharacterized protein isoform X4 n=1 Tax=Danio rerio TaxID=7955 RepID=A0AC58I675_DANRE